MLPHAKFAFRWDCAKDDYFNVFDNENTVYQNQSTISGKTVEGLGLPVVRSVEDEEKLIHQMNCLMFKEDL